MNLLADASLAINVGAIINYVIYFIVVVVIIGLIASTIKIIREYERLVVFRLGRLIGARGPGVVFIFPFINRVNKVDLRERYLEVPHQTCITKDNAPVDIDFLIYNKVTEATQSIVQVQNFEGASIGIATTTLRAVVGDIPLDELLAKREQINQILRSKLDEVTERWGIKVTNVEIREITPPEGRAGGHGPPDVRGEDQEGDRHRSRRQEGSFDPRRRGREEVEHPQGRRGQAGSDPQGRRVRRRAEPDIRGRERDRLEDDGAPVPGHAEGARRFAVDEVHLPHGVHRAPDQPAGPGKAVPVRLVRQIAGPRAFRWGAMATDQGPGSGPSTLSLNLQEFQFSP